MFIQAGIAIDSPTACHLVWGGRYMKADLTHQFVWWCVHKIAVIPTSVGSIGSHLLATHAEVEWYSHLTSIHNADNTSMDIISHLYTCMYVGTVADTILQLNSRLYYKLARWVRSQVLFLIECSK